MRTPVIFLLVLFGGLNMLVAQQDYNSCAQALEICPGVVSTVNNIGANITLCPGCEDDFNFCFATDNTIWLTFTTNASGGDVQVDITNLLFVMGAGQDNELQATIIEAGVPCAPASYNQIGNCVPASAGNFALNAIGLPANTTYYIVIDGDNNGAGITTAAECSFDVSLSGTGVDRLASDISLSQSDTDICQGDLVSFQATLTDCPDSTEYNWFVNGNLIAVTTESSILLNTLNNGDVVTVSNTCYTQCPVTVTDVSQAMNVYSFVVEAGDDVSVSPGEVVTVNGVTTAPVFSWTPSYLFSDPNSLASLVTPTETVTITLTATENGCTLTDYLTITMTSSIEIPNTFSPNSDNVNDTWEIRGIELYPNNIIQVYDRWGQEVFQTTSYSDTNAWDGTKRGKPLAEGVYFYVLDLREEGQELFKGSITLIR